MADIKTKKFKLAKMNEQALSKYLKNRKWNNEVIDLAGHANLFLNNKQQIIAAILYENDKSKYKVFIPE